MTNDIFGSLFDLQNNHLKQLGNPLLELGKRINWEAFRPLLGKIHERKRKSKAGAPPREVVIMFKGLIVQNLYGLTRTRMNIGLMNLTYNMRRLCFLERVSAS